MDMEMSKLPVGWTELPLESIADFTIGGDWGKELNDEVDDQYVKVKIIRGTEYKNWNLEKGKKAVLRKIKKSSFEKRELLVGDIVVEVSGGGPNQPVGRTLIIDKETLANNKYSFVPANFCRLLRLSSMVDPFFINYNLLYQYSLGLFNDFQNQTTNLRNLNYQNFLQKIYVSIPPYNEQKRIVAKLDKLLARVETAKERLDKIPQTLKRFRQSVLSAAVSSELTKDWRDGNNGNFDWKEVKLKEISQKIQIGPFGTQLHKSDYISNGIPLINPSHIKNYHIVPDYNFTISKRKYSELKNYHLCTNDIIMARRGEMGRCALVGENENNLLCGTGSLFIRPTEQIFANYLFLVLKSEKIKRILEVESKGTTMNNLNLTILKSIPIDYPSLDEQKEIVRRVEELFKFADQIEARYNKAKQYVDKLTQSILAKAFRGELVPQDPNDEPAEKLLERIKEEKEKTKTASNPKRKKKGK